MRASTLRRVILASIAFALTPCAPAGVFRAYVSAIGSDANPCSVTAPCRLLPAALNAVNDGGEIWMLDSANYNTTQVGVSKSVSILAVPGALGSVVATGGVSAILVNGPGIKVSLRNLVIVALGTSAHGIHFSAGAALNVEDCEILNLADSGIFANAPDGRVSVRKTVFRENKFGVQIDGNVQATLDDVQIQGSTVIGALVLTGARLVVSNSVLTRNPIAVYVLANPGGVAATVVRSVLTGNFVSLEVDARQVGSNASLVSDGNTIVNTDTAFFFAGGSGSEVIFTRGNNTVGYTFSNAIAPPGGSLTACCTM